MRFLLSGGGTAGHIYPALTVAELLARDGHDEAIFVGTPDGLEARLVREAGIPFEAVPSAGFDRGDPVTALTSSARVLASVGRAIRLIRRVKPDVVAGFGGYVSLPVGIAAVLTGTPLVLHEQNSVPGLANRVLSRFAAAVGVTYPGSIKHLRHPERAVVTGNPVREAVLASNRDEGRRALGLAPDSVVLLVFGGSRGARHINQALVRIWPQLAAVERLQVVHVAGRMEAASVAESMSDVIAAGDGSYQLHEYLEEMGAAIAAADLVIARAGATSIAEITAFGRAAILVPYPYATDDHQTLNARAVAAAGAAVVVPDAELDEDGFAELVVRLLRDDGAREAMAAASAALGRPDAGRAVADLIRRAATRA